MPRRPPRDPPLRCLDDVDIFRLTARLKSSIVLFQLFEARRRRVVMLSTPRNAITTAAGHDPFRYEWGALAKLNVSNAKQHAKYGWSWSSKDTV